MYTRNCEIKSDIQVPSNMSRIALTLEYNGTEYHGFQSQSNTSTTIQQALETAISKIANESITLVCAGRTDAGVHATNQVVHFDTLAQRPNKAWVEGVNTHLPDDIRVTSGAQVDFSFHARFSATARTYRYVLYTSAIKSAIYRNTVTCTRFELDTKKMSEALQVLIGEHDFSAFRAAQCQARNPIRHLKYAKVSRVHQLIVIEICANAFLHHMVRNIVGSLIDIGRSARSVAWLKELLDGKDRSKAAATAAPFGLYLVGVGYPAEFQIESAVSGPLFLP